MLEVNSYGSTGCIKSGTHFGPAVTLSSSRARFPHSDHYESSLFILLTLSFILSSLFRELFRLSLLVTHDKRNWFYLRNQRPGFLFAL
jgi:hypothetical protein